MSNALVPYAASGPVGAAAPAGAASAARAALSLYKPTGAPGRTGDPVADLEAKLKYINETVPNRVTNVSGSTAGAGSGDFHAYRMARRREQSRMAQMDEEERQALAQQAYDEKLSSQVAMADARSDKLRAKRLKKKDRKRRRSDAGPAGGAAAGGGAEGDDDEDDDEGPSGGAAAAAAAPAAPPELD